MNISMCLKRNRKQQPINTDIWLVIKSNQGVMGKKFIQCAKEISTLQLGFTEREIRNMRNYTTRHSSTDQVYTRENNSEILSSAC